MEGIFATLNTGDRDIIISGITITDKRKQMVDFSAPYFPPNSLSSSLRTRRWIRWRP